MIKRVLMSELPERLGPSLLFIYFMIGFVLGAFCTMVGLAFVRPFLPPEATWVSALVVAPLIFGSLLGWRVTHHGSRAQLSLGQALFTALGLRRREL